MSWFFVRFEPWSLKPLRTITLRHKVESDMLKLLHTNSIAFEICSLVIYSKEFGKQEGKGHVCVRVHTSSFVATFSLCGYIFFFFVKLMPSSFNLMQHMITLLPNSPVPTIEKTPQHFLLLLFPPSLVFEWHSAFPPLCGCEKCSTSVLPFAFILFTWRLEWMDVNAWIDIVWHKAIFVWHLLRSHLPSAQITLV